MTFKDKKVEIEEYIKNNDLDLKFSFFSLDYQIDDDEHWIIIESNLNETYYTHNPNCEENFFIEISRAKRKELNRFVDFLESIGF